MALEKKQGVSNLELMYEELLEEERAKEQRREQKRQKRKKKKAKSQIAEKENIAIPNDNDNLKCEVGYKSRLKSNEIPVIIFDKKHISVDIVAMVNIFFHTSIYEDIL